MANIDIFQYDDYKEVLQRHFRELERGSLQNLAKRLGVNVARISRLVRGNQHPTPDQAFIIAKFLQLAEKETEFFVDLVSLARSTHSEFKSHLRQKLDRARSPRPKPSPMTSPQQRLSRSDLHVFHSSPLFALVWLASMVEGENHILSISKKLGVDVGIAERTSGFLVSMGLCRLDGDKLLPVARTFSFDDKNNLKHFLGNWRIEALQHQEELDQDDLFYSLPMAIGKDAFLKIKEYLKKAIREAEQALPLQSSDYIACMNIDLFRCDRPKK